MKIFDKTYKKLKNIAAWGLNILEEITSDIILPGFKGYSLYDIGVFFFTGIRRGAITIRASSIAFNIFIAVFPGMIFLFSLIPYIPIDNFHNELFVILQSLLPESVFYDLQETIEDTIMVQRTSTLSIGFILMLFFSSNGIISMIEGFNASYYDIDTRSFIGKRIISIFLVIILSVLLIVAISLIAIGNTFFLNLLLKHPELNPQYVHYLLLALKWLVILFLFFLAVSFLFYLAPSKKSRFTFITPGCIFATALIIIAGLGFSYYINNFAMYNVLYGSIGTVIAVMLLFYITALALILGFELNVSILKKNEED